jgi:hypothetical protein
MASLLSSACRRSLSEWKTAYTALIDAIQVYTETCLRLESSCAQESGLERKDSEGIWTVYKTLDEAIPTLVSHEETLRHARARLQRRRNVSATLSPIRMLSPDLLSQIFILVVESTRVSNDDVRTHQKASLAMVNVLASICSHWRHIAISTGTLWSHVDLLAVGSFEHAAIWISRAKGCLLDIHAVPEGPLYDDDFTQPLPEQDHKAISLPDLLHPARVRSIVLHADKSLSYPWLSWWFEHGVPGTVTTLALQAIDPLSFPVTTEATPQGRTDELLRSVDTLYLYGIGIDRDSLTFRDLTTLHLASLVPNLPMQHLVQILSASPRIQCLQLACIELIDHENMVLRPIQLNHLEILELCSLTGQDLKLLFNMLLPGSSPLTLSFRARWDARDAGTEGPIADAIVSFCRLAKVTKFCFHGLVFPQDLSVLSDLEILVFKNVWIDESICNLISPRSDIDLQPLPTLLSKLHTIETPACRFMDVGGFKRVLATCPIRTFRISAKTYDVSDPDQPENKDFESWAGPGIDFEDVCREDAIGYLPFGGYFREW